MTISSPDNSSQHDRDARFLALLADCEPHLSACVHAIVPIWQDAEEVLQETRVVLWQKFDDFCPGSNPLAWVRTIARYQARAHLKKDRSHPRLLGEAVVGSLLEQLSQTPEEENRRWTAFVKCSEELAGDARHILQGVYVDRQSIKDIADRLARSVGGTYKALSRIRRRLMECVEQRLQEEEA